MRGYRPTVSGPVTRLDTYVNEQALANAVAFAEWGFPVVSVWGVDDGVCRCVAGAACRTPGKHPIPRDGFKAATTDVDRVTTMLKAAGSDGQYGVRPAPNTILIDADGEGYAEKVKQHGLTDTLIVRSGNGLHLYFYWPPEYGPVPTHLFGWKVRSADHEGIVIGAGSQHASGKTYRMYRQNGHDVHEMLASIKNFPQALVPQTNTLKLVVSEGVRQPESIGVGSRHDYLRDTARFLRGRGLVGEALFEAVNAVNMKMPEPKPEEDVRRAIGDVETRFGEDPVPLTAEEVVAAVPAGTLFTKVGDYLAALPANIEWVSPLAAYGFVSLVAGPPKAGKSTLVSNLLWAREHNEMFLWGDDVPEGPTVLVTEEGGLAVARKVEGLTKLDILDRKAFIMAGLSKLDHLLAALQQWCAENPKALIVIDTLAIWGDIEDENDAGHATRAIAALAVLAQVTGSAIILIHHARKGGGDHGEAIRGSGAILGTVDQAVELSYATGRASDDRKLELSGRLIYPETRDLIFDRATNSYSVTNVPYVDPWQLDLFPVDGAGGWRREDAEGLWGLGKGATNKRLATLVADGRLLRVEVHTPGDRMSHPEYTRPKPLLVLDNRSVGEQMSDIFAKEEE